MVESIYSAKEGGVIFRISGPGVTQLEPDEEANRTIGESAPGQQILVHSVTVLQSSQSTYVHHVLNSRRWIGRDRISPRHRIINRTVLSDVLFNFCLIKR